MTENKTASSESSAGSPEAGAVGLPLVLDRRFKVIVFDWDGTAVMDRREDASEARRLIERLLEFGVHAVVVTGTNLTNIERQMSSAIQGHHKSNLYVCANRGSEVYGFDAGSRPVLIWGREATPKEDRLLTEIADAVRDAVVARTGLDVRVIYDRLNRRKIDLIPLPEWQDPPKSTIGDLLSAVEARLRGAGMVGGLRAVIEQAETVSRKKGLKGARVTSDVKHVEVGLTEKSHSINWVMRELVEGYHISREEVLIVGDEFGPVSGFPGSDAKMVTPHSKGAVFLSVGAEPEGVPSGIIHLGGGPARFREVLRSQVALQERLDGHADGVWSDMPASPTRDAGWLLVDEGFNLAREH
ncbi:MAG: hypothetical protein Q7R39_08195, partial [Dehalococcoidia bacterium]|nr:hypothetical protein [Dehalococcoidia bacterium]